MIAQINKNLPEPYKSCFNEADYAQQTSKQIITATLILVDDSGEQELSLDQIDNPPQDLTEQLFNNQDPWYIKNKSFYYNEFFYE